MYIRLIEQFYSKESLEASNGYYLMGVYYSEQGVSSCHKAIACFGKAMKIRQKKHNKRSDSHVEPSIADCLLNLGILYKQRGLPAEAEKCLVEAQKIRKRHIGTDCIPTSNANEELGKFYIEQGRYEDSYKYLRKCYEARAS